MDLGLWSVDDHQAASKFVHWSEFFFPLKSNCIFNLLHFKDFLPTDSFFLIFDEHFFDQVNQRLWSFVLGWNKKFSDKQLLKILVNWSVFTILIKKGVLSIEGHLVKNYTKGKYVHLGTTLLFYMNLGRHIQRSTFRWHVRYQFHIFDFFR